MEKESGRMLSCSRASGRHPVHDPLGFLLYPFPVEPPLVDPIQSRSDSAGRIREIEPLKVSSSTVARAAAQSKRLAPAAGPCRGRQRKGGAHITGADRRGTVALVPSSTETAMFPLW